MNIENFKYIEFLQKRNQYVFFQKSKNEKFFKKYNKFKIINNQFKNQLIIV